MLIYVAFMHVVEMAIVQIISVSLMLNALVTAIGTVLMLMFFVLGASHR